VGEFTFYLVLSFLFPKEKASERFIQLRLLSYSVTLISIKQKFAFTFVKTYIK